MMMNWINGQNRGVNGSSKWEEIVSIGFLFSFYLHGFHKHIYPILVGKEGSERRYRYSVASILIMTLLSISLFE